MRGGLRGRACVAAALALSLGCAPKQIVPLDLAPADVTLFVDGRAIEGAPPGELELRSDRPHVLFFRKPGYEPQQVVLTSERVDGGARLRPARVEVRLLRTAPMGRRLDVELEEQDEAAGPDGP